MESTIFAPVIGLIWRYLEHCNIDPLPIYKKAGIDPELRFNAQARIEVESMNRLWQEAADVIDDPTFGVKMVGFWHPSMIGALGYAWLASTTLRQALGRVERYIHAISQDLECKVEDTPAVRGMINKVNYLLEWEQV